ncbi:hypothetical protein Zmor_026660 [Zophobas morio]|uniref:RCC1 domain-containing protein 1 n=1 Tax=Zophobas morio TaxID=2755281 RepID=A0AA38HUT3_9CUCU|nr:hypothetical protein Zmor_026660 [Zophobas morio]
MKVYYNGFNLHRQFPNTQNIVKNFIDHVYNDLEEIEVSYHYIVLLVAGIVVVRGAINKTVPFEPKILRICCDEDKVVVLLENGDLFKIDDEVTQVPKFVESDDCIIQVSTGSKLPVALTRNGNLYTIPNKLEFNSSQIIEAKTGREHCLLLDKNGNVFSFGRGSRGQLGHGSLEDEPEPKLVEALGGIKIKAVDAGGWHSVALSGEGDLYVWGWNGHGQLGLSDREDSGEDVVSVLATPQVLDLSFNLAKVSCGSKHTVVLSEDGRLYGCGWNKYNQLKEGNRECIYKMVYLESFSKEEVNSLKCGPWNTLVLCKG